MLRLYFLPLACTHDPASCREFVRLAVEFCAEKHARKPQGGRRWWSTTGRRQQQQPLYTPLRGRSDRL